MNMACFIVPLGLGIITTLMGRVFPKKFHIGWLNAMLLGGAAMLMVEHVAHGEIMPYPPFLSAGISAALPEMLVVGTPMALFTTSLWASMVMVNGLLAKKTGLVNIGPGRGLGNRGIGIRSSGVRK